MATVQMAANGFGGVVQGNYGNYQAASDGTFTIDMRDAVAMLALGMSYVSKSLREYTLPKAPAAAAVGAIVASGTLSNGTVAITAQPDVMRPLAVAIDAGTVAITAGTVTITYAGNDGNTHTDVFSAVLAASGAMTGNTSYGVVTVSSVTTAGLVGGAAPGLSVNTTAALALPVGNGAADVVVEREYDAGTTIAIGTMVAAIGCIVPTTVPNGTVTYGFVYNIVGATS